MPTIKGFSMKDGKVVKGKEEFLKALPIRPAKSEVVKEHIRDVDPDEEVRKKTIKKYKRRPKRKWR